MSEPIPSAPRDEVYRWFNDEPRRLEPGHPDRGMNQIDWAKREGWEPVNDSLGLPISGLAGSTVAGQPLYRVLMKIKRNKRFMRGFFKHFKVGPRVRERVLRLNQEIAEGGKIKGFNPKFTARQIEMYYHVMAKGRFIKMFGSKVWGLLPSEAIMKHGKRSYVALSAVADRIWEGRTEPLWEGYGVDMPPKMDSNSNAIHHWQWKQNNARLASMAVAENDSELLVMQRLIP